MKTASDFVKEILRDRFAEKQAGEQSSSLLLPAGLLHDAHAVILDEPGHGDFPGHFQKRKIMFLAPGDDLLRHGGKIAAGIDDEPGTARILHGGDKPEKPAIRPGLHSGGDGQLRSAETADDGLILHHMHPAHYTVHAVFSGKKAELILTFCFFKHFPEANCHRISPPVCTHFLPENFFWQYFLKICIISTKKLSIFRLSDDWRKVHKIL